MHPYTIWEYKGGYHTYVPDKNNKYGRRRIKRKTKQALENEIIKVAKGQNGTTIQELFDEFIERKIRNEHIKPSTAYRYQAVFKRHYVATRWNEKAIENVGVDAFSDFIEGEIMRCDLNSKSLSGLKGVTTGILKRAAKEKLIPYNYTTVYDLMGA